MTGADSSTPLLQYVHSQHSLVDSFRLKQAEPSVRAGENLGLG